MKKNKTFLITIVSLLVIFAGSAFGYIQYLKKLPPSDKNLKEVVLSNEDTINLTKPAVVRLIQHVKGKAEIPDIKIDWSKFDVVPNPSGPKKVVDVDEYMTGSGFIVNSDGYIITNSHVVSYQTIKNALAGMKIVSVLLRDATSGKEPKINDLEAEEVGRKLATKIINYLVDNGKFTLEKKVVVINPSSTTTDKNKMFEEGFSANIVSVNDKYFSDNRDIALIKIDQTNLPTLAIGNSTGVNSGNKISVFGFPGSAEFNGKSFLESTFTNGTINAFKNSDNSDFKLFQSDAKVSPGSSGGPMLNDQGRVIGILTYASNTEQKESGDSFAFAIPITEASSWVNDFNVNPDSKPNVLNNTEYADHFKKGISYLNINQCQKAIGEFNRARDVEVAFSTDKYIQSYIDKCQAIISSGQSVNTKWDEKRQDLAKINKLIWLAIGGGVVLLVAIIFIILILIKRLRKNEQEMQVMEDIMSKKGNHNYNNYAQDSAPLSSNEIKKENPPVSESEGKITFKQD